MKPHPRIRKTIKWGGAAVTVLLVVVWIGSGWLSLQCHLPSRVDATVSGGLLCIVQCPQDYFDPSLSFASVTWHGSEFSWMPKWGTVFGCFTMVWIPLGIPFAASTLMTFTAWRLDTLARRRAKLNLCPKCGYDRTGILKDAKCPECGRVPNAQM